MMHFVFVKSDLCLKFFFIWLLEKWKIMSFCRLGVLACYLDPFELYSALQDSAVSSALWQQLAQCISKGFVSDSGRVRGTWFYWHLQTFFTPLLSSITVFCVLLDSVRLALFNHVFWIAVFMVDTSCSEPECQQHGPLRAVCPQWSLTPVRGPLLALTPHTTTLGSSFTTRTTQIFSGTGQHKSTTTWYLCFYLHMWINDYLILC